MADHDTNVTPSEARDKLKTTLRQVANGEPTSATATERMRAALALATLDDGVPSTKAGYLRHVINGTTNQ